MLGQLNWYITKIKAVITYRSETGVNTGGHNTELVNCFVCLGSGIVDDKSELSQIQMRLILANDCNNGKPEGV
jgi:hypothetical protein